MKFVVSAFSVAVVLVALASVPPSSRADNSPETITVYNAQHESLAKAWVEAFTKETGIKVDLRNGDDSEFANQIVAGRRSLAGRRVPHRELAGHGAGRCGRPVRAGRRRHPGPGARGLPACRRPLGRDRGALDRVRLRQDQADAGQAAEVAARPRRPELEGPLGRLAHRAPTSRRSSARCSSSRARRPPPPGCKAMKENVNGLPGQQHRHEGASMPARSRAR